jgi:hypothetical protein
MDRAQSRDLPAQVFHRLGEQLGFNGPHGSLLTHEATLSKGKSG